MVWAGNAGFRPRSRQHILPGRPDSVRLCLATNSLCWHQSMPTVRVVASAKSPMLFLALQTLMCLTFHHISLVSTSRVDHCSKRAVSFLLRCSALRPYAFTYRAFLSCARREMSGPSSEKRTYFALANLMAFFRSQLPDSPAWGLKRAFKAIDASYCKNILGALLEAQLTAAQNKLLLYQTIPDNDLCLIGSPLSLKNEGTLSLHSLHQFLGAVLLRNLIAAPLSLQRLRYARVQQ